MENATATQQVEFDGTIESAVDLLIQPDEPEENLDVSDETDVDDVQEDNVDDSDVEPDEDVEDVAEDDSDYEDEDEDTDSSDDESEQTFTVKVDGTEKSVTLDELKRGYSGQQYVQKGMQEAASAKKEAEAVYNALIAERQQVAQLYQQLQSGQVAQAPQPPSRELFDSDPIGYMEAKLQYDDAVQVYQQQQARFEQMQQQNSQAQQAAMNAYLQQELKSLQQKIPELADPKSAAKVRDKLVETGSQYGFSTEEIAGIVDSRAVHVLRDAMKYREIMAGKKEADKKANPAKNRTRPVKAGVKRTENRGSQAQKQAAKLKRTGSIEDAVSLIFNS